RKCHAVGMEEDPNGGAGDGERLVPGPVQAPNYRPGLVLDFDIVTDIAVATTSRRLRRELAGGRYGQRLGARNAQHLSIVLVDCVILRYRERRARRRWQLDRNRDPLKCVVISSVSPVGSGVAN